MVVLIGQSSGSAIKRVAIKAEILRTQALAGLLVGTQINDSLAAPLNGQVWRVVGVEAQAGVVKIVASKDGRSPVDDPATLRTEAVVDLLLGFTNVNAIDEARDGNKSRADVVVLPVISKMQAVAAGFESLGGSGVMIAVALVS